MDKGRGGAHLRSDEDVAYSKRESVAKEVVVTLARLRLDPINKLGFLLVVDPLQLVHSVGATPICLQVCRSLEDLRNLSRPGVRSQGRTQGQVVHRSSWYQDRQWLSPKFSLIRPTLTETILSQSLFYEMEFKSREAKSRRWMARTGQMRSGLRRYVVLILTPARCRYGFLFELLETRRGEQGGVAKMRDHQEG